MFGVRFGVRPYWLNIVRCSVRFGFFMFGRAWIFMYVYSLPYVFYLYVLGGTSERATTLVHFY